MMRFQESGIPYRETMSELGRYHNKDFQFKAGKIFGSMCTSPVSIAREVYMLFIEANLGNPGLCPGTAELEERVIGMLLDLLGMDLTDPMNQHAGGQMVSGGTEANITALWLARNLMDRKEIIIPESGHFSLFKAADLLGMRTTVVPLTESYQMDLDLMQEMITEDTAVLVGVAGTTELGQIDPIKRMGEIAGDMAIPLHVDAAFGGFVLPFLEDFRQVFDFRSPGVISLGVDPHKMGLTTIPSGALLLRDRRIQEAIGVDSPYLTVEKNMSLSGTRNSASVAATYAVMRHLGREGYQKVVDQCMDNTRYLQRKLGSIGLAPVIEPVINVLAVPVHEPHTPQSVIEAMNKRGWHISRASHPPSIRFVIMPHVTREHIDSLIEDLEEILSETP